MELQTAFYIIGIVYMSIMIIIIFMILTAVLVIKSKINKFHDMVEEKVNQVKNITDKTSVVAKTLKNFVKNS